jgi:hypothetical protein
VEIQRLKVTYISWKFKAILNNAVRYTIEPSLMESKSLRVPISGRTRVCQISRDDALLMVSQEVTKMVTPANPGSGPGAGAGVYNLLKLLDSGFRGNHGKIEKQTFCEFVGFCDTNPETGR